MKKRALSILLSAALLVTAVIPAFTASAEETEPAANPATAEYEVYPIPQSMIYGDGLVDLPKAVTLFESASIDEPTDKKIKAVLSDNNISYDGGAGSSIMLGDVNEDEEITSVDATLTLQKYGNLSIEGVFNETAADVNADGAIDAIDATLMLQDYGNLKKIDQNAAPADASFKVTVGVDGDQGFDTPEISTADLFQKTDSYILEIAENGITIVGRDTDGAYYGVVTLMWILDQCDTQVRPLVVEDYADAKTRGFIEGYYGLPWSDADRISLMTFGGSFKMTSYVFAPKDDPYHNSQWTTPYPEDRLEELKEVVQAGVDSKCRFVWSIHPFMNNKITADDYDEKLELVKAKFEQLYSIGVRQFGIMADDASSDVAIQRQLCIDMTEWCEEKGDCYDLIFCPQSYNYAWTSVDSNGKSSYFTSLCEGLPESVQICWTGNSVCAACEQSAFDRFHTLTDGRDALMWINWPCNDINKVRLLMGRGELLKEGVTGFSGIISNPMQQAEPSKVALFAVADYTWNRSAWNVDKSWEDSFKYIEPNASDALYTMAKHLSDPTPNTHGETLTESEEIAPLLDEFTEKYAAGESIKEIGTTLIGEYEKIIAACNEVEENASEAMVEQMQPWIDSLRYLSEATKYYIQTAIAFEEDAADSVIWSNYSIAAANYSASQNCPVQNLDAVQLVQAGSKRLMPFAETLATKLAADVLQVVDPDSDPTIIPDADSYTVIKSDGITGIYSGTEAEMFDGDKNTFCWYKTANDSLASGNYLGVDLGSVKSLKTVTLVQDSSDKISSGVLEYSEDGVNYTALCDVTGAEVSVALSSPVAARYVRVRTTADTGKWFKIYEFTVGLSEQAVTADPATVAFTNVPELAAIPVTYTEQTAELGAIDGEFILEPGEYIGIALTRIKKSVEAQVTGTGLDSLTLEYSMNGVEWTNESSDARYIRLINKTNADITASLSGFAVSSYEILPISVVENTLGGGGDPLAAFDGDRNTRAHFQTSQASGKKVIYDLGQMITVNDVTVVMYDGENDYIRNGIVSISADGTNWTNIITMGNGSTDVEMGDIYTHDLSYYVIGNDSVGGVEARYLKVELTSGPGTADKWTRFSEIEINSGVERATTTDPTFVQNPVFYSGKTVDRLIDNDLFTTYLPKEANSELIYHISELKKVKSMTFLQSPATISNAVVSVRTDADTWVELGTLSDSMVVFSGLSSYDNILDVKIKWTDIIPELHELIVKYENTVSDVDKTELKAKIAQAEAVDAGNYTDDSMAALTKALIAARGVDTYAASTEKDVASAIASLQTAINGLVECLADKTELNALIEQAAGCNQSEYTTASWSALETALESARTAAANENLLQADCNTAVAELQNALDYLTMLGTSVRLDQSKLSAYSPTAHSGEGAGNAVDGDESTVWHTPWSTDSGTKPVIAEDGSDNYITITLDQVYLVNKLEYVTRSGSQTNGNISGYKIYYSQTLDGDDFVEVKSNDSGYGAWTTTNGTKSIEFVQVNARRIKLVATSTVGDQPNTYICAGEIYISQLQK